MREISNCNCDITKVTDSDVKEKIGKEPENDIIYIVPESRCDGKDVLNGYSSDMGKIASRESIPCEVVHSDEYVYLILKDSQILLPFIISISAAAVYDLIKIFITKYLLSSSGKIKLRMITKKNQKTKTKEKKGFIMETHKESTQSSDYQRIDLKGNADDVLKALEILIKNDEI